MSDDKSNEEYASIIATILKDDVACKSMCKAGTYTCCWECDDRGTCTHPCDTYEDAVSDIYFRPPYDHCNNSITLEDMNYTEIIAAILLDDIRITNMYNMLKYKEVFYELHPEFKDYYHEDGIYCMTWKDDVPEEDREAVWVQDGFSRRTDIDERLTKFDGYYKMIDVVIIPNHFMRMMVFEKLLEENEIT